MVRDSEIHFAPDRLRPWAALIGGVLALALFAFVVIPWLNAHGPGNGIISATKSNGVDASALFYTETPEVSEAVNYLGNSSKYSE
ncbi:MAG: hypothetical protein V3U60_04925 [Gammaproteobacteria bacterium]